MYVSQNPKSKAELKRWIAAGRQVRLQSNSPFDNPPENGVATVEGPHYPQPHRWYGQVTVKDGIIVSVQ